VQVKGRTAQAVIESQEEDHPQQSNLGRQRPFTVITNPL
jgi:hypothetical protein